MEGIWGQRKGEHFTDLARIGRHLTGGGHLGTEKGQPFDGFDENPCGALGFLCIICVHSVFHVFHSVAMPVRDMYEWIMAAWLKTVRAVSCVETSVGLHSVAIQVVISCAHAPALIPTSLERES